MIRCSEEGEKEPISARLRAEATPTTADHVWVRVRQPPALNQSGRAAARERAGREREVCVTALVQRGIKEERPMERSHSADISRAAVAVAGAVTC